MPRERLIAWVKTGHGVGIGASFADAYDRDNLEHDIREKLVNLLSSSACRGYDKIVVTITAGASQRVIETREVSTAGFGHRDSPPRRYSIASTGNGLFVTITRLSDSASVTLCGDDAASFAEQLSATTDRFTDDDLCSVYDDDLTCDQLDDRK